MVAYVPYRLTHTVALKFLGRPWCSSICSAPWLVVVGAIPFQDVALSMVLMLGFQVVAESFQVNF